MGVVGERLGIWEADGTIINALLEFTVIEDLGVGCRPQSANICPEELVVRVDHDGVKALVVVVHGTTTGRTADGHVLSIYGTTGVREVPLLVVPVSYLAPLPGCTWADHQLIQVLCYDGFADLSDDHRDGVVWYSPSKLHGRVGVPRAWFHGVSHEGVFLGESSSHSLQQLIIHGRVHAQEVGEGSCVLISELHHQLIIDPKLMSSPYPWPDPGDSSARSSYYSSLSSLTKEMELQVHDIMLVLDNSNHVFSPVPAWICHLQEVCSPWSVEEPSYLYQISSVPWMYGKYAIYTLSVRFS